MKFKREYYIEKLISSKHNHLIKIVIGLRRVGKSYLLFNLYKQHLLDNGVDTNHVIEIQLDSFAHRKYRKAARSLTLTDDSFTKIIITTDDIPTHTLPNGIIMMNVFDYLLS